MNCSSAEELFERFLDGDLANRQRAGLLEHVGRCKSCTSLLDELRVVDALLLAPRRIELAPDFTHATMTQAGTLAAPLPARTPVMAYVVSYLAGAWMIVAAAFFLAPHVIHGATGGVLAVARSITVAIGGLGTFVSRELSHRSGTIAGIITALFIFDALLVAGFGVALTAMRPRWSERLRS